jgi:hypothetical protein
MMSVRESPCSTHPGELIEHWTLRVDEIDLVTVEHGDGKLAFALLLRFYGRFGRFPRNRGRRIRASLMLRGGRDFARFSTQSGGFRTSGGRRLPHPPRRRGTPVCDPVPARKGLLAG